MRALKRREKEIEKRNTRKRPLYDLPPFARKEYAKRLKTIKARENKSNSEAAYNKYVEEEIEASHKLILADDLLGEVEETVAYLIEKGI